MACRTRLGSLIFLSTSRDLGILFAAFLRSFHRFNCLEPPALVLTGTRPKSLIPAPMRIPSAVAFRDRVENPHYHPPLAQVAVLKATLHSSASLLSLRHCHPHRPT